MDPIPIAALCAMLNALTFQELREVYGLMSLELPWVLVELTIHAIIIRRMFQSDTPLEVSAIEFFRGDHFITDCESIR